MSILFKRSSAAAPFRLSVSPSDVFIHPAWQRAHAECLASLAEDGRAVLCGVPGTGKTMLLHDLCATLRVQGRRVALLQHGETAFEAAPGEVLLIDEADRLSSEQIRRLCALPNPLVLAGLPGLCDRLGANVGLMGSITLDFLSASDIARLVAARLAASGRPNTSFGPDAVAALARHSAGLFRLVIILAGAALFFAEMRGADAVTPADVHEAATMREALAEESYPAETGVGPVTPPAAAPAQWFRQLVVAAVVVVALIGVFFHLAVTAGDPAAAAVDTARGVAKAEPSSPAPLWPKRPIK